jgi:AbrB family looped-hinge helix DNA binding protein
MSIATITTKGQVTIPKNIRDSLKLKSGDKIEIIIAENREAIIRPISKSVDDIFGMLKKENQRTISVEEMNTAVSRRMKDKF